MRFAYGSPRSTKDLDFSVVGDDIEDAEDFLRSRLNQLCQHAARKFGLKLKPQKVKRNPRTHGTFPTYSITIGYQFPGDAYYEGFEDRHSVPTIIYVEISFNEKVCACIAMNAGNPGSLNVCTLEDILAEKLRSLLQQPIRNRHRPQDVFDIAYMTTHCGATLNKDLIRKYLIAKCDAREIPLTADSFDENIRQRAMNGYDSNVRDQAGDEFISFDVAWRSVEMLIEQLRLPG